MPQLSHVASLSESGSLPQRASPPSERSLGFKKRKRGDDVPQQFPKKPLIIRPLPSSVYDKPYTLKPIHLLYRSRLPLCCLEPTSGAAGTPSTRLFSSHIDVLEVNYSSQHERTNEPVVLVARLDLDKSLYAIERVKAGVYALCKLANWVKARDISTAPSPTGAVQIPDETCLEPISVETWWHGAVSSDIVPRSHNVVQNGTPKLFMIRPTATPSLSIKASTEDGSRGIQESLEETTLPDPIVSQLEPKLSEDEIFENVVIQYLEALYLSKASLAYFSKGPLSRARAAFTSGRDREMPISHLTNFLRNMLLPLASMEKKYREKIPQIVKDLPILNLSDEEAVPCKKKKRLRKLKPNREGLYSVEEEYVKTWWLSGASDPPHGLTQQAIEHEFKSRTADLRIRETLTQMILIFEIMVLETSVSAQEDRTLNKEAGPKEPIQVEVWAEKKKRPKKPQDLKLLLDLLVDKLCIWQSIEQEGSDPSQTKVKKENDRLEVADPLSGNSDKLRGFCVEVIIPFYLSRLPEQASSVNKKLGGPSTHSPAKESSRRKPKSHGKPGEPETRHQLTKRKSPHRASTDVNNQLGRRSASLARSATDSGIPGLKREASVIPLSDIPPAPSNRSSLSQFKRFSQREVDLSAMSAANEAKAQRKAKIEEELKQAITALKKPNRDLAIKEYVDSVEQRSQGSAQRGRKPPNPRRVANTIQVTATPKRARKTKSMVQPTPLLRAHEDDTIPPSSDPCIPSSAIRPPDSSCVPASTVKATGIFQTGTRTAIEETPSRGPKKTVSFFGDIGEGLERLESSESRTLFPSSEAVNWTADQAVGALEAQHTRTIEQTPVKRTSTHFPNSARPPPPPIFATPVKLAGKAAATAVEIPASSQDLDGGLVGGKSIYDALGWDDDFDDL